ncbi:MAG TPA: hypothetical protein VFX18_03270 [Candidatus Nitrosocosmicus sp.]|nr:hypothetical protein [Candidatus Nitrosocosmicus sp.]
MSDKIPATAYGPDIMYETGGVKFIVKTLAPPNTVIKTPTPQQSTPAPAPSPNTSKIGPDGVLELWPTYQTAKHPPIYLDLSKGDPSNKDGPFAITYGGDMVKSNIVKGTNGATCLETEGHKVTYKSGAKPGMSTRAHFFYDIPAFAENSKMKCWEDKPTPEFLHTEKTFYDFEMTAIIEPGDEIGKDVHKSIAFKTRSIPDKPNDKRRSTFEFCFPPSDKKGVYVNYNYAHATYAPAAGVKQFIPNIHIMPNTLYGLKVVSIIANDKKSTWYGGYINLAPLNADGTFNNNGWKLLGEYTAKGIPAFNNIPPTWGGATDYLRVDGFKKLRIYNFSIREIEKGPFGDIIHDVAPGTAFELIEPPQENHADFNTVLEPTLQ